MKCRFVICTSRWRSAISCIIYWSIKLVFSSNYSFFQVNGTSIWLYIKSFNKNSFQNHYIVLVSFLRAFDGIKWSNTTSFLFGYLFILFQYATQTIWNSWGWGCEGECGCYDIYDSHRSIKHPHTHPQLKPGISDSFLYTNYPILQARYKLFVLGETARLHHCVYWGQSSCQLDRQSSVIFEIAAL
jgi:hypothetical protein